MLHTAKTGQIQLTTSVLTNRPASQHQVAAVLHNGLQTQGSTG
jgi:hypothetical protein